MTELAKSLYISGSSERANTIVKQALKDAGYEVVSVHNVPPGAQFKKAITEAIQKSDLIVADISEQNPNTLYEIGYAHALGKKTQLLVGSHSEIKSIPSDLAGSSLYFYKSDSSSIFEDKQELTNRFARQRESKEASEITGITEK